MCSDAISPPANVSGVNGPYIVDVEVKPELAAGLHHIYAQHAKMSQSSECSEGVAYRVIQPMTANYRVIFTGAFTPDAISGGRESTRRCAFYDPDRRRAQPRRGFLGSAAVRPAPEPRLWPRPEA